MRKALGLGIAVAAVALALPATAQAGCHDPVQTPVCWLQNQVNNPLVKDRNIAIFGSAFMPDEIRIPSGGKLIFQNFDSFVHTATYESATCRATTLGQTCTDKFDRTIGANARLNTATYVSTLGLAAGTYNFYCKIHSSPPLPGEERGQGMVGSFTVVTTPA